MSSSLADDEYNFFAYPSLSCFLAIIERRRVNAVSGDFYRSGWGSSRRIAQLLLGYGVHVAPGIVYSTLDSRPGTALSAIGRFYARRSFGLPMEDRSQHRTRSVSFMISTTEPPSPCPSVENTNPLLQLLPSPVQIPALEDHCRTRIPEKGTDEKAKTPAENLGRYKSGHPEPRVFLPGTTIVLQQATRRFGKCSLCRQRVSDRWQRC